MARIKRGVTTKRKHNKILNLTKGYRMTKSRLIKVAREATLHAGEYAFHGRKRKKRDMRASWITRLNGQLQHMDLQYSRFINGLKKADIQIDRKQLSSLSVTDPEVFKIVVDRVREKLN